MSRPITQTAALPRRVMVDDLIPQGTLRDVALGGLGVALLILASNIRIPFWPVPVTMQTFAVLMLGATYGARLGGLTILAWLALGAAGVAVFSGDQAGLAYLAGPTGGYLLGFLAAGVVMGALARRGWDRTLPRMVGALLIGNAVVYAFGLPWMTWLFAAEKGMAWVMQYGLINFLVGDLLKLVLAAMVLPTFWRLRAR